MENGKIRLAEIFTDHMVLQRNREIRIFGYDGGTGKILVRFAGIIVKAESSDGKWEAVFPPMEAGGPYTLDVWNENEQIHREDILTGEIWIAAGQSNMAMPLQQCAGAGQEFESPGMDSLRYYIQAGIADEGDREAPGIWKPCVNGEFGDISGVAYYCGSELVRTLEIPVGIIQCAHPGTGISCWMEGSGKLPPKGDRDVRKKAYETFWKEKRAGSTAWPPPVWEKSPFWPGNLYECMVKKIAPYPVRGVLYYQGEEDAPCPEGYGEKLKMLISQWRNLWNDDEMPFVLAQLPAYDGKEQIPDSWPLIREQQAKTAESTARTELVTLIDCGEKENIHPQDKKTPGIRMAKKCLCYIYGRRIAADGARAETAERAENGSVIIEFTGGSGKIAVRQQKDGFPVELAGRDGKYYRADFCAEGNRLTAWAVQVPEAVYIRYAFQNYGRAQLFDENGFPVAPFRKRIISKGWKGGIASG